MWGIEDQSQNVNTLEIHFSLLMYGLGWPLTLVVCTGKQMNDVTFNKKFIFSSKEILVGSLKGII